MEGYHLVYRWKYASESSRNIPRFRPTNNSDRNWYLIIKNNQLNLCREQVFENITLKGFIYFRCRTDENLSRTIAFERTMEINCGTLTVASLPYPFCNYDIDCLVHVSNCKVLVHETKSVQYVPELLGFDRTGKLLNLDDTGLLDTKTSQNFSNDMLTLYDKQDHSDFVLFCNDREFRAHKCVLSARSPIFAQMFQHATTENTENKIIIEDVDPCVLENLLRFMYSGRVKQYTFEEACGLYYASDKYAVLDLQDACREIIISSLSTLTVFEVLVLADKHQDGKLLKEALAYSVSVFQEIKLTPQWAGFQQQYQHLSYQVLSSVVDVYSKFINNA